MDIREKLVEIISDITTMDIDQMRDEDLLSDYNIDSLDFANFVFDIEEKFDIYLSDEELEKMRYYRLGQLVNFIENKINE